jgi:predicted DCC family thiol-disulfide oxidoreductase YuxK
MSTASGATPRPSPSLVVLYDGECRFCIAGAARLARLAAPGALELASSKDPSQLARFPQVTQAAANRELQVVGPDGHVFSGAAAIAAALNTRPAWRAITWLYRVPGIHALTNALYALVAANRYRIAGRAAPCDSGACGLPSLPRDRAPVSERNS